jgi:endonuclease I
MKGDIARQMFYMAVRYEGDVSGDPDLELITDPSASTSSSTVLTNINTLIQLFSSKFLV